MEIVTFPRTFPHAASLGDVALVQRLINSGHDVNAKDSNGSTGLHLAIASGKGIDVISRIVGLLLAAGASVDARNNKNYTPLHLATINCNPESVHQLLEAGADPDAPIDVEGVTPLRFMFTCKPDMESGEILCMLIDAGASTERGYDRGPNRISPLRKAILGGKLNNVKKLVTAGADVNAINWHGKASLHTAVETPRDDDLMCRIIEILLKAGASPDIHDFDERYTPLHAATIFGKVRRVELLVKVGANLEAMTMGCMTSIHFAISSDKSDDENFQLIQLLVQAGASITQRSGKGYDALETAISVGKAKVVEYLIKLGAIDAQGIKNPNATNLVTAVKSDIREDDRSQIICLLLESGTSLVTVKNFFGVHSPLHKAVCLGRVKAVELLTKAGANVHETFEKTGETCLHSVVRSWSGKNEDDRLAIIRFLVDAGASVDAVDLGNRTPLYSAIVSGNAKVVERFIRAGANVNLIGPSGKTSFHVATSSKILDENRSKIIQLLTDAGASLNTRDKLGRTPLDYAVLYGHASAVEQLIKAGADVNSVDPEGHICLHMIAQLKKSPENYSKIVDLLLKAGALLEKTNNHGRTPLHFAVCLSEPKGVEKFIRAGTDVKVTDKLGQTSLHLTIRSEDKSDSDTSEIVQLLLEAGVSIECRDNKGCTPLHVAVITGKTKTVKTLIDAQANANATDLTGATYLHLISSSKLFTDDHVQVIQCLILAGASLDSRDHKECLSPLHYAVNAGNVNLVKHFIKIGADVNAVNKKNMSTLHLALCSSRNDNSHQIIQLLLKAKASLFIRDVDGKTPLIYTASFGDAKLLEQLIASGADAKAVTIQKQSSLHFAISKELNNDSPRLISILLKAGVPLEGFDEPNRHTPLHYATIAGDVRAVEKLIRAGADVNAIDCNGMTNLHLIFCPSRTLDDRFHGVIRLLLKAGAKLEIRDKDDKTPLVHAITSGNPKYIQQLIRAGADASISSKDSPILHHAVRSPMSVNDCLDVIPLLLTAGASLESRDQYGRTPLTFAAAHGCTKVVEQLIEAGADVNATDLEGRTVLHYVLDDVQSHNVPIESKRMMIRLLMGSGAEKRIASTVRPAIRWKPAIRDFFNECRNELSVMQKSIVVGSVTFHQILMKKGVTSYMRNEHISEEFNKRDFTDLFPIFGNDLKKSFFATQAQKNLMDQASQGLNKILGLYNASIHDKILLNLNNGDLRNLRDMKVAAS